MISSSPFPDDYMVRLRAVELELKQIRTSLNTRPAQDTIRTSALTIGDPAGPHIKLIPAGDGGAEIWLVPAAGAEPTRLVADVTTHYPSEATFHVLSAAGASSSAEFNVASGEINMSVHDANGTGENGGQAYWGWDTAAFGYIDGTSNNYFFFSPSGVSRHFGQWDDFADLSSSAGWLWGSITVGGSGTGATINYPSVMASNMGPIITLRNGQGTAAIRWAVTASSTSGVTVSWDVSTSVALYMCSFRH